MYLRNAWYVAGWSADFPEGKLVARGLLDGSGLRRGQGDHRGTAESGGPFAGRESNANPADRAVIAFQRIVNRLMQAEITDAT